MSNNQQPNSILNRLLNDMDEEQIQRHPLQPHGIVGLKEDEKRLYATFLATLLIDQPISTSQSRLLMMLLDSMKLSIQLPDLYVSVAEVDKTKLQAFLKLADEKALSPVFLMDALVLCRLDKSLTENQAKSLAEFVSLLSVDDAMLVDIVHLSNKVLSYQENNENAVAKAVKDKTSLMIDFDYELLKHWHEFSYQVLTTELLQNGLTKGEWIINDLLQFNSNINIDKAIIFFAKNGKVSIENGALNIFKSYLSDSNIQVKRTEDYYYQIQDTNLKESFFLGGNINFQNIYECKLEGCDFYSNTKKLDKSFLVLEKTSIIKIESCKFYTSSKRAIDIRTHARVEINDCKFQGLGVSTTNEIDIQCTNSEFLYEDLAEGSAYLMLRSKDYSSFNVSFDNCEFLSKSLAFNKNWNRRAFERSAIYIPSSLYIHHSPKLRISKSKFENTCIAFKVYTSWGDVQYPDYYVIEDSTLVNTPVFTNATDEKRVCYQCNFKNSDNSNFVLFEE